MRDAPPKAKRASVVLRRRAPLLHRERLVRPPEQARVHLALVLGRERGKVDPGVARRAAEHVHQVAPPVAVRERVERSLVGGERLVRLVADLRGRRQSRAQDGGAGGWRPSAQDTRRTCSIVVTFRRRSCRGYKSRQPFICTEWGPSAA